MSIPGAATREGQEEIEAVLERILGTLPSGVAPLAGSTAVTGVFGPYAPALGRRIRLSLSGIWAGTVTVKRSVDGGNTKLPLTVGGGLPKGVFTGNCNEVIEIETEAGAAYYLDVALSSGNLTYRMAQ